MVRVTRPPSPMMTMPNPRLSKRSLSAVQNTMSGVQADSPRFEGMSLLRSMRTVALFTMMTAPLACVPTRHPQPQSQQQMAQPLTWQRYQALSDNLHQALETKQGIVQSETALNQELHNRLFPEMKRLFLSSFAHPNVTEKRDVVLGEFTHPDWVNGGMDGGRGLRLAFRRTKADNSRTSAIVFVDYNPKTQQFEWVNQTPGSRSPDIIRFLHETEPLGQDPQRGFMGISYTGHFSPKNSLTSLTPTPYYLHNGEPKNAAPVSDRILPDELQPAHCIMCHGRKERQQFFRIDFEKARVAPGVAHQKSVDDFDAYLRGRDVPSDQRQQIRRWLANPAQHWQQLMPKNFLAELNALD